MREKTIPKASGKVRSLGIPTTADRVVQASLKLVLEPIFEADFKPCSFCGGLAGQGPVVRGFLPARRGGAGVDVKVERPERSEDERP